MKNKIIQFIKKHPFLYNTAKKINRKLNKIQVREDYEVKSTFYVYVMKEEHEFELIKKHYAKISNYNTKLLIIINNPNYNKYIHKYIRENPDILFISLDYFKKYHKTINVDKFVFLDYNNNSNQEEILEYVL